MSRDLRWTLRARLANGSHAPTLGYLRSSSAWPRAVCLPITPRQRDRVRMVTIRETPTVIDYDRGGVYPVAPVYRLNPDLLRVGGALKYRRGTSIALAPISRRR